MSKACRSNITRAQSVQSSHNLKAVWNKIAVDHDIPLDNFLDHLHTNTLGEFLSMKYEIPYMRRQGGGVIVNMASVSGLVGFNKTAHYCASKHGIIGMTKTAALENAVAHPPASATISLMASVLTLGYLTR